MTPVKKMTDTRRDLIIAAVAMATSIALVVAALHYAESVAESERDQAVGIIIVHDRDCGQAPADRTPATGRDRL